MLLPRPVAIGHAHRPAALEHDPARRRLRQHSQVRPRLDRVQERHRARTPPPVARGQLEIPHPLLLRPVVIRVERIPRLLRRRDPRIADRPLQPHVRHRQRALVPVKLVRPPLLPLRPLEQRQHVVPAPAGVAHLLPAVVILRLPPHVQQPVQRRRPAQHLAPRPIQPPAVQPRVGLRPVAPVDRRVVHGLEIPHRNMDPRVPVPTARLHQHDLDRRVGRQPIRQNTARRASTDNHVIR